MTPLRARLLSLLLPIAIVTSLPAASAGAAFSPAPPTPIPLATLTAVQHHLTLYRSGQPHTIESVSYPAQPFINDDQLLVAFKQKASLRYCNKVNLALNSANTATSVTITSKSANVCNPNIPPHLAQRRRQSVPLTGPSPQASGVVTNLRSGEAFTFVEPGANGSVATASATAESIPSTPSFGPVVAALAASPTSFDVKVLNGQSVFTCVQGDVVVQAPGQQPVTLKPGQQTTVTPGSAPSEPTTVDTAPITNWTSTLPAPGPTSPDPQLLGSWVRSVPYPSIGMTDLTLQVSDGEFTATATLICGQNLCPYGPVHATAYGSADAPNQGLAFTAVFDSSTLQAVITGDLENGLLEVVAYTVIPDGNAAFNTVNFEEFQRGEPQLANPNQPPPSQGPGSVAPRRPLRLAPRAPTGRLHNTPAVGQLLGDWMNVDSPASGNIARLILRRNGSSLSVHAYGICDPTPCDWGTVPAEIYAVSPTSSTGAAFTAAFNFGTVTMLVAGVTADADATPLVVTSFITPKDPASGPSTWACSYFQLAPR